MLEAVHGHRRKFILVAQAHSCCSGESASQAVVSKDAPAKACAKVDARDAASCIAHRAKVLTSHAQTELQHPPVQRFGNVQAERRAGGGDKALARPRLPGQLQVHPVSQARSVGEEALEASLVQRLGQSLLTRGLPAKVVEEVGRREAVARDGHCAVGRPPTLCAVWPSRALWRRR